MEKKRLKIAYFVDTFYPMVDGVIVVVDNYAKCMAEYADVTVFCPLPLEKEFDDSVYNYKVVRCKSTKKKHYDYPIPNPDVDSDFQKILHEGNFDIVHIHDPFFISKDGVKYAKQNKIPVVGTLHSQYKRDFFKATKSKLLTWFAMKFILHTFNACDEVWAVNKAVAKVGKDDYKIKAPIYVYDNATDMLPVDAATAAKVVNEKFNIAENEHVLLYSGRINVIKNILLIVDSLKLIKDAGISFKMLFVGSGQDEEVLNAHVKELGLTDNIIMAGRITDRTLLAQIYSRANLFLFPSVYDCSSLVQIEAASQRTPTVFIRDSVTSSTATENVNCLMSENNPESFAAAVIKALQDEKLLHDLSENAFRDLYVTWDSVVDKIYDKYLELAKK